MKGKIIATCLMMAALSATAGGKLCAQTVYKNNSYQWKGNSFVQGEFRATAVSPTQIVSNYSDSWDTSAPNYMPKDIDPGINRERWTLKRDISHLPHYRSSVLMDNALFNLSLEESELAIEADSTYRTGVYWGGVWTRDVSYSIMHSLAQLCPEVSMKSLRAKINDNNRIIQDTGTGGAWPCSTDRTVWILAAWEVYKVTGDRQWLDFIYPVIRNTIEDDRAVAFDPATGLMRGETSWLDWREQEYPVWMQPSDIYMSEAMNTNAVHYRAISILADICRLEGQDALAARYDGWAAGMKAAINRHLWMEDRGLYGIYLYGRDNLVLHPQMEIQGESFAILWDIADEQRSKRISQNMVSEDFGTPDFYPNLKDQYPYHNDAMWPFTQIYWTRAQAKAGNEKGVLHGISSVYRLTAMTLTNLENMVIYSGAEKGLPINSPRQLWSVAADLAIVPGIYFGMDYELDGIHFNPFVPKALKGERSMENFRYRDAVLSLKLTGYGNRIKSFKLDGKDCDTAFVPAGIKGEHSVEIVLSNEQPSPMGITMKSNDYQPLTPVARIAGGELLWDGVADAGEYIVLKNGKELVHTQKTSCMLDGDGEYAVVAIGTNGYHSYMSEPLRHYSDVRTYKVGEFAAQQEEGGAVRITRNRNILITIPVDIEADGRYIFDWRYANGNGPINTENKCCIRMLTIDGIDAGACVFPHRGSGEWDNWGWSNQIVKEMKAGHHVVTLEFRECTENMNLKKNEALLDVLRISSCGK